MIVRTSSRARPAARLSSSLPGGIYPLNRKEDYAPLCRVRNSALVSAVRHARAALWLQGPACEPGNAATAEAREGVAVRFPQMAGQNDSGLSAIQRASALTNPERAAVCAQTSLLTLPGASAPGAFPPFGQRPRDAALSAAAWKADTHREWPREPFGHINQSRKLEPHQSPPTLRGLGKTSSRSSVRPALDPSQAKEPVAIQPGEHYPFPHPAGGSSRPPAWRFAGRSCSAVSAEEATSRSGWKPRANSGSGKTSCPQHEARPGCARPGAKPQCKTTGVTAGRDRQPFPGAA